MANPSTTPNGLSPEPPKVGELLADIGNDMKTIASTELELARRRLSYFMEQLITRASVVLLGATVALIGIGMLCVVAVVALEPVIAKLWLRLLIMALVYLVLGGGAVFIYAKRMAAMTGPDLAKQVEEVGETFDAVKNGLSH